MKRAGLIKSLLEFEDLFVSGKIREVELTNKWMPTCWKVMGCNKRRCPAYGMTRPRCWQIPGTFCNPPIKMMDISQKWQGCRQCSVFLKATPTKEARLTELLSNIFSSLVGAGDVKRNITLRFNAKKAPGIYKLTPRESQILDYLINRHSRKQIAAEISLSEETVKDHMKNIYHKLDVSSRDTLIAKLQR